MQRGTGVERDPLALDLRSRMAEPIVAHGLDASRQNVEQEPADKLILAGPTQPPPFGLRFATSKTPPALGVVHMPEIVSVSILSPASRFFHR